MKFINRMFDIAKYKKLRKLEYTRWIGILIYMAIYFAIEAYTRNNNIEFYVWDTILTSTILLLVFIFGNFFCGYACFMQRFQDAISVIARLLLGKWYNSFLSAKIRRKVKWFRYIFAILTLMVPFAMRKYGVFLQLWGWGFTAGMFLTLIERRAYCKYFCFVGALFKVAALRNQKSLVRNNDKCINCNLCSTVCPQDCDPATKNTALYDDLWCTSCGRCKAICPTAAIQ